MYPLDADVVLITSDPRAMLATLLGLNSGDWTALAAWSAVIAAGIAGLIARGQLHEAQRLREKQSQPYVVIYAEESAAGDWVVEIVVRNFGATAATDVTIVVDPPLLRAVQEGSEPVVMPAVIPTLAPGQEWRAFWDTTVARHKTGLPSRHEATVRFGDDAGQQFTSGAILDWVTTAQRDSVTVHGLHSVATALRDIRDQVKRWQETPRGGGGLAVYVRDGDARDERSRQEWERRQAEHDDS